jgi:hypothetical protein
MLFDQELQFVLQRTGDPSHLYKLWPHLELLASLDAGSPLTNGSSTSPSEQTIETGSKTPSDEVLFSFNHDLYYKYVLLTLGRSVV